MAIEIKKVGDQYTAKVTLLHRRGASWNSGSPKSRDELISLLLDRGCHQADIGDAFYEADPEWLSNKDS